MGILKLRPGCKDYIWGGHRLVEEYGKQYDGEVLAETWELSCHPDGPSVIAEGAYAGRTLQQYIDERGKEVLGTHCRRFRDFPILIKFIDARDNLSIQVHPDNRYALKNEGQYGKTEMWYVMDAGKEAFLYYGFQREISKEEFQRRIEEDTLLEVLHAVPVQKGDVLFIESGTIHAIGKDILIAEIQQNSNVTYRVYDYGRVGRDGRKRDLHIEKALAVTNRVPIMKDNSSYPHVADCDYFTVDKLNLDGIMMKRMEGNVTDESFASVLVLDGEGTITCQGETLSYRKGDSFFLSGGVRFLHCAAQRGTGEAWQGGNGRGAVCVCGGRRQRGAGSCGRLCPQAGKYVPAAACAAWRRDRAAGQSASGTAAAHCGAGLLRRHLWGDSEGGSGGAGRGSGGDRRGEPAVNDKPSLLSNRISSCILKT